jgi:hypothetical protein
MRQFSRLKTIHAERSHRVPTDDEHDRGAVFFDGRVDAGSRLCGRQQVAS